jgi:hypothetical protein
MNLYSVLHQKTHCGIRAHDGYVYLAIATTDPERYTLWTFPEGYQWGRPFTIFPSDTLDCVRHENVNLFDAIVLKQYGVPTSQGWTALSWEAYVLEEEGDA